MAKIDFHFDSQSNDASPENKHVQAAPAHKVGLLSSIPVPDDLLNAFLSGFGAGGGAHGKRHNVGYMANDLKNAKRQLKQIDKCNVIATVGGYVVFESIRTEADNPTFVSLTGDLPPNLSSTQLGNCAGIISLNSWKSNAARVSYLTNKLGCNASQIGLYYNQNSTMSASEQPNWDTISPIPMGQSSSAKPFSGGVGGANDPSNFAADLAPAGNFFPPRVRALVISGDPFFQSNKDALITAVNSWLTGAGNRYVCFPFQEYDNGNLTKDHTTLYGPSLSTTYRLFGALARSAADGGGGFFTAGDLVNDIIT